MATLTEGFSVIFPEDYDERAEYETPRKGYLNGVVVQLEDGSRYQLSFIDPVRLQQDLEAEAKAGDAYFAEPNLIVLPEVTTATITKAVKGLVEEKFFEHLKPL